MNIYMRRIAVIFGCLVVACAATGMIGYTFGANHPITIFTVMQAGIVAANAFIISSNLVGIRDGV